MIRKKIGDIKLQLYKVSVANTDVEKSLLRSFFSDLRVPNPLSANPTKWSNTLK